MSWFFNKNSQEEEKLKKEIETTKEKLKIATDEKKKLEEKNKNLEAEKKKLEAENKNLEAKNKNLEAEIANYKKYGKKYVVENESKKSNKEIEESSYAGVFDFEKGISGFAKGWKIYEYKKNSFVSKLEKTSIFVSTVGLYGKGKTFLHSNICDNKLPHGISYHTRGISIQIKDGVVIMDTEGYQTPISMVKLNTESNGENNIKKLDDDFLSNVILSMSDVFLFVVHHLTLPEQEIYLKIKDKVNNNTNKNGSFYLIHNFSEVVDEEIAKILWKEQVENIFAGEMKEETENIPQYFIESGNVPVRHFCLWNEDSELGKNKNPKVFNFFKTLIQTFNFTVNHESIIEKLQRSIDNVIPHFFPIENRNDEEKNNEVKKNEYTRFELTQDENEKTQYIIGTIKPSEKVETNQFNRYLEGLKGTSKSQISANYDELIENNKLKIIFDTPGLCDQKDEIKLSEKIDEIKKTEFKTKLGDTIKIGVVYLKGGFIEVSYERILSINKDIKKRNLSRPEGSWTSKIELPNDFKNFGGINFSIIEGHFIITILKLEKIKVKNSE